MPTNDDLCRAIQQARGELKADLVIKNATVLDVISGSLREADIAICGPTIAGLGHYSGRQEIDARGLMALPGFIDAHVHIESSLLAPEQFAAAVVPRGTTSVVADPHELANVAGRDGVKYVLEAGRRCPLDVFVTVPSCVPASHLETSGAELGAEAVAEMLTWDGVLGLGEMMNFPGVINCDEAVIAILAAAHGRLIEGHAPGLSGPDLQAYAAGGPRSDHESTSLSEAEEKAAAGMTVYVREGGAARNLEDLAEMLTGEYAWRCCLVTDDCNARHLAIDGHIDHILRRAVALGVPAHVAVRCATLIPAMHLGLRDRGLVAPGLRADIVLVEDLKDFRPRVVLKDGVVAARDGRPAFSAKPAVPEVLCSSCHLPAISASTFAIHVPARRQRVRCRVIDVQPGQIITGAVEVELPVREGRLVLSGCPEPINMAAVIHRHGRGGGVGVGLVRGFGLKRGALASTVAHDSHNLVIVGAGADDVLAAARAIEGMGGGQVVVEAGAPIASLALPIGGLMTDEPVEDVARQVRVLEQAAARLGCSLPDPFMTLSFLALPVIPELKLTDLGLVDVGQMRIVPVVI